MKRCKTLLCLALALIMALSLCTVAMAEETVVVTGISFTMGDAYGYGKRTDNQLRNGGTVDYLENGTAKTSENVSWFIICDESIVEKQADNSYVATTDYFFAANKQYYLKLEFTKQNEDNGYAYTWSEEIAADSFSLNGVTAEIGSGVSNDENSGTLYFALPKLKAVPLQIPFTAITKKGGNVVPGTGNFELEVANATEGSNRPVSNYTFGGLAYTTNGVAEAPKYFTIQHDHYEAVLELLNEGIVVTQKNNVGDGWSHDDTAWGVTINYVEIASLSEENMDLPAGYYFEFYEGKIVDKEFTPDSDTPATSMSFENTYTKNTVTPKPSKPAPTVVEAPKTFDGGVALCAALSVLSMTGAVVVGKKRDK